MKKSFRLVLAGIATTLSLGTLAAPPPNQVELVLLLVSDIYKLDVGAQGGFPRVAAVARNERKIYPNLLYIHAGDTISPSLLSTFNYGAHTIELLNYEPLDIFVPGNHEYDFGEQVFRERMAELDPATTLLAANLRDANGKKLQGFEDSIIYDFDGLKVGVIGMTAGDSAVKSSPGNLQITQELVAAQALVGQLREAGADLVVGVTHSSRSVDLELRKEAGFDILLTGDDHDLWLSYDGETVVAEAREEGEYLVAIHVNASITEKDGKRRVRWTPRFRVIDTGLVEPLPEAQAVADGYLAKLNEELDVAIGTSLTEIDSRRPSVRGKETAIGNMITDAMRESVNADVALTNGGGIRGDKIYPAGSVLSRKDILSELPFGNRTMLLEVSGATLLAAIENGLSKVEDVAGRFPHVSGMKVVYDLSKPAGSRIVEAQVAGRPVSNSATYKLATNDYMAAGGDGYKVLSGAKRLLKITDADLMASQVINYVENSGTVSPKVTGRLVSR